MHAMYTYLMLKMQIQEYQQSEKAFLVTALQKGLCKCRQYLRSKYIIQSSCPRYNVSSESDEGLSWWQGSKLLLRHTTTSVFTLQQLRQLPTPWCTTGRRTWFSWQGSSVCSHHYCHTSHCFLNTHRSVRKKLTVSVEHSDVFPEENDSTLHKSHSDQSWEKVWICTLYSYIRLLTPSANKHLEKPTM